MDLILTLGEKDPSRTYELRKAARAVVFGGDGNIALLRVTNENYYKLPGGGIEEGENIAEALKRECKEEIGCDIEVVGEIGKIIEYRHHPDGRNEEQESFCYTAKLKGMRGVPHFDEGETMAGFRELWIDSNGALRLLRESKPTSFVGEFVVIRDKKIIEEGLALTSTQLPEKSRP